MILQVMIFGRVVDSVTRYSRPSTDDVYIHGTGESSHI